MFFHSLDMIPQQWYLEIELCLGTTDWDEMMEGLLLTYRFAYGGECINEALQEVKTRVFWITKEPRTLVRPDWPMQLEKTWECYKHFDLKYLAKNSVLGEEICRCLRKHAHKTINDAFEGWRHQNQSNARQNKSRWSYRILCQGRQDFAEKVILVEFIQKVTVGTITVDCTMIWSLKRVGGMHLMGISGRIYRRINIYEEYMKEIMEFEFEFLYKSGIPLSIQRLCALRFHSASWCLQECRASYCMPNYSFK